MVVEQRQKDTHHRLREWIDTLRGGLSERTRTKVEFEHVDGSRTRRDHVFLRKGLQRTVARMRRRLRAILPEEIASDLGRFEAIDAQAGRALRHPAPWLDKAASIPIRAVG